jgi:hypothetical protein
VNDLSGTKPEPPRKPALEECCCTGCEPCVFDVYAGALECYHVTLAARERLLKPG